MPEPPRLDDLVDRVAAGQDVDWAAVLAQATGENRSLLEQLRVIAAVGRVSAGARAVVPLPGSRWGPFELLDVLDQGSYGVVMRARDTRMGREVALKLLVGASHLAEARFLAEARALARVRHPNVVAVHGADRFDDIPGLWMELIEGHSLADIVDQLGPLGPREAALVGVELCAALSAVHGAGFVHGDVKSRNVMRQSGGRIVLTDFGGAHLASTEAPSGTWVGTPLYSAPELFEGARPSPQTDLYALAVVLFHLLTGTYPVTGDTVADIRKAHHRGARRLVHDVRADVPPTLAGVIDRALSANPAERYGSAGDLQRALLAALDVGIGIREPASPRGLLRRVPLWAAAVLGAGALLVGHALGRWFNAPPAPPPAVRALTDAEWALVVGYRDFADALTERGEWEEASRAYRQASALFANVHGPLSAAAATDLARAAFAASHGPQAARASGEYDTALFHLTEGGGEGHLLRSAINAARAVALQRRGRVEEAADLLDHAVRIRETLLNPLPAGGRASTPRAGRLADALRHHSLDRDQDGDWLPDAVEAVLGLDPLAADSDDDGQPDSEGDADADGLSDGLQWGVIPHPSLVLGVFGAADPATTGARVEIPGEATPAVLPDLGRPAWRLRSPHTAFYSMPLTDTQRRWATTRGWRLLVRARPILGQTFVTVDLSPVGPQYPINLFARPAAAPLVRLFTRTMPRASLDHELANESPLPVIGLEYDPSREAARLTVDGRTVARGYTGLARLQAGRGLVWGTSNDLGNSPAGEGVFDFVALEIKP